MLSRACGLASSALKSWMRKPDADDDTSWIPRLELELLRSEAAALVKPADR